MVVCDPGCHSVLLCVTLDVIVHGSVLLDVIVHGSVLLDAIVHGSVLLDVIVRGCVCDPGCHSSWFSVTRCHSA